MELENQAGAEQIEEVQQEEPGLKHLGELLQETEPQQETAGDAGASGDESAPSKFNDLAGKLGMDLDALYKLEVSQAEDGTPVTIENLKDLYTKQGDIELREVEFEESRSEQEASLMQAQTELQELMAALPEKAIKPEVLQRIRDKHVAQVTLERQRTLTVIPEWNEADKREADITGMAAHMKQYGYPDDYLAKVVDHKQLKYIRDNWQREQRIRKALALVKAGKPSPTARQKPASKAPVKKPLTGVKRGSARNKLASVFSELD